ncbi:MAG: phage holin family protein [Candidatus Levyibacteriota bacterium]|jgi:putative membrane protein
MKGFIRNVLFNAFSIFLLTQIVGGVKVTGGLPTYLFGGIALTILLVFLKPILNILSLPLNIITLGLFSFVTNIIIFYLLTVIVPGINIIAFTFPGFSYSGFVIPSFYFNVIFAFLLVAFLQSLIVSFLTWLVKK